MFNLSALNLKLVQIQKLEELKSKIKKLEEENKLLKKSQNKLYDL